MSVALRVPLSISAWFSLSEASRSQYFPCLPFNDMQEGTLSMNAQDSPGNFDFASVNLTDF